MDDQSISEKRSAIAENRPRDAEGHFVKETKEPTAPSTTTNSNPLSHLISTHTTVAKTSDDTTLLDVHVGNPLKKITALLEEIKKQKAFSFDIKGSLGIAGVIIVVTSFGVFGWVNTLVCSKGMQTFMGTIRTLRIAEAPAASPVPMIDGVILFFDHITGKTVVQNTSLRTVLINPKQNIILDLVLPSTLTQIPPGNVIVTGEYDSCHQVVTVSDPTGVEEYY